MPILDEIKSMQQQGKTDQEISQALQQSGFSPQQISNALSQSQIKNAVSAPPNPSNQFQTSENDNQYQYAQTPPEPNSGMYATEYSQNSMQPSMLSSQTAEYIPEQSQTQPIDQIQSYSQQPYSPQNSNPYDYGQYSYPTATPISSDTITEISEQVVSEKLSSIRKQLEKNIDIKNVLGTQVAHIDERLLRIEKIIDRLQLSILQKVGDYSASISDLKKELLETQKSFSTISSKSPPQSQIHHKSSNKHTHKKHKV